MIGPRTIRAKLTLTTVLVMGALLTVLGSVVYFAVSQSLLGGIDQELLRRGLESEQGFVRALARERDGDPPRRPFRPSTSDPLRTLRPRLFRTEEGPPTTPPYDAQTLAEGWNGRGSLRTVLIEDQPVRVHTRPLRVDGRVAAVVQIPFGLSDTYRALDNLRRILLFLIPVGAALTGLASLFLIDRLMRPLRLITQNAERIGANTLADRIPVVGRDEFAYLGTTLNGMLDRLQRAFLIERETSRRLEESLHRQRRFTADASHELKTPLTAIKTNTSLVRLEETTPSQAEGLAAIDEAADRMNRLVKGLLLLAKAEAGADGAAKEPCLLPELAWRAVRHAAPSDTRVEVVVEDESATVIGVFDDLARMIQNLVDNALQHSGASAVTVTVRSGDGFGEIEVHDNGKGIPTEHLPHLFDRFYRVDQSRTTETGRTGLGLAIARGIAEAHGGTLEVASEVGEGTTFTSRLPLVS